VRVVVCEETNGVVGCELGLDWPVLFGSLCSPMGVLCSFVWCRRRSEPLGGLRSCVSLPPGRDAVVFFGGGRGLVKAARWWQTRFGACVWRDPLSI